jgi:hypothetical protein
VSSSTRRNGTNNNNNTITIIIDSIATNLLHTIAIVTRCQFHQRSLSGFDQKRKKTDNLTVFFALSGSARIKAAGKMLVKLTQGVNFSNILQAAFVRVD